MLDKSDLAFPRPATFCRDGSLFAESQQGMSLREWYAGLALQGILSAYTGDKRLPEHAAAAEDAVAYADALLKALSEQKAKT